jgi:hypothetical protein
MTPSEKFAEAVATTRRVRRRGIYLTAADIGTLENGPGAASVAVPFLAGPTSIRRRRVATVVVAGGLIGLVAGVLLGAARGGKWFGLAYGLLAAGVVWSVSLIIAGSRADGMAGISDLVLGGVLLWLLVVPAGVACLLMEYRKRRSGPRSPRQ